MSEPDNVVSSSYRKEEKTMSVSSISSAEFVDLCQAGKQVELLDVRTPVEFREVHVDFAKNVPLDQLDAAEVMQARSAAYG